MYQENTIHTPTGESIESDQPSIDVARPLPKLLTVSKELVIFMIILTGFSHSIMGEGTKSNIKSLPSGLDTSSLVEEDNNEEWLPLYDEEGRPVVNLILGDSNTLPSISKIIPAATPADQVWTVMLERELNNRGLGLIRLSHQGGMFAREKGRPYPHRSQFIDSREVHKSLSLLEGAYIPTITIALGTNDILALNDVDDVLAGMNDLITHIVRDVNLKFDRLIIVLPSALTITDMELDDGSKIELVNREQSNLSEELRKALLQNPPILPRQKEILFIDPDTLNDRDGRTKRRRKVGGEIYEGVHLNVPTHENIFENIIDLPIYES